MAAAPPARWTIRGILAATAEHLAKRGIDEARLDAELLLAHALACKRIELFIDHDRPLAPAELDRYRGLVRERGQARVPLAYLTGRKEFYSLELEVTRDALVPRPETEMLVDAALAEVKRASGTGTSTTPVVEVADIGTGTGAIAIAIAKLSKAPVRVHATEISPPAAALARRNAERHGVQDRVLVYEGDLLAPLEALGLAGKLALIASNPPYVALSERDSLAPEVLAEPPGALFSGQDGLDAIRALLAAAPRFLAPGGLLLVEHGAMQGSAVAALARAAGLVAVETRRDLGGRDRMLFARRRS